jgi:hypothetical protein
MHDDVTILVNKYTYIHHILITKLNEGGAWRASNEVPGMRRQVHLERAAESAENVACVVWGCSSLS